MTTKLVYRIFVKGYQGTIYDAYVNGIIDFSKDFNSIEEAVLSLEWVDYESAKQHLFIILPCVMIE